MKVDFTEDEMIMLAMYKAESKDASLDLMEEALFAIEQDPVMAELIGETINKVTQLRNEEYLQMDLSGYEEELERISAEDYADDEPTVDLDDVNTGTAVSDAVEDK